MLQLDLITKQVCNLSRAVGIFILDELNKVKKADILSKGNHDFVTYVDKTAEKMIIKELSKIIPEAGFIAEESPELLTKKDFNWIIDPLDGTTNFIHNVPLFAISIALQYQDQIISGVVYEVNQRECFYSWKDAKVFLNDKVVSVSNTDNLDQALLATGFPYYDYSKLDEYLKLFKYFMQNTRGVRRLGSAAVDLAYTACGRFDGFYEYGLSPWDVAAGSFLIQQAGGHITDFSNKDNYLFGKEIIASNKVLHKDIVNTVTKFFG